MTKEEAVFLMREYAERLALDGLHHPSPERGGEKLQHLLSMPDRFPDDGSEKKSMRWLGFIQGVLWMSENFELEELKEHSRRKSL